MKKAILALALSAVTLTAMADGRGGRVTINGHHAYRGHDAGSILVPMVIGGIIGYGMRDSQQAPAPAAPPVVIQQQPVIIHQPPVTEAPKIPVYRQVQRYNVDCACYVIRYEFAGYQ